MYADEFMVTKTTIPTHDYSKRRETLKIDYRQYHKKTIACVGAISEIEGAEQILIFEKSIDRAKFIQFLKVIRKQYPFKKIAFFLDNLRVHLSKDVAAYCKEAMFKLLFNAPYSPNFNPIEGVIGMTKMSIKRERWNALKMGRELDLDECIK